MSEDGVVIMRILAIILILAALSALGYLVVEYGGIFDSEEESPSPQDNSGSNTESENGGDESEEENGNDNDSASTPSNGNQVEEDEDFWSADWVDPRIVGMPRQWRNPHDGAVYVLVPGGVYTRGSNLGYGNGRERPKHEVFVGSFYVGRHAVTRQEFSRFVNSGAYTDRINFGEEYWTAGGIAALERGRWTEPATWYPEEAPYPVAPNHPVTGISWYEAHAYARFVGGRLPREAEWEKAARGTETLEYPWGDEFLEDACNWRDVLPDSGDQPRHEVRGRFDGYADLAPVDAFEEFASPYGAVQMSGNTFEWCQDWLDEQYYQRLAQAERSKRINPRLDIQDPIELSRQGLRYRVVRGGAYDRSQTYARAAYRHGTQPFDRDPSLGMRVVIDVAYVRQHLDTD